MFALSKFTNVLTSAVEAAFAPETSLYEDFQYHWRAIMNYYIETNDEKTPINMTNIPNHFSQMLQILIQEEAEIKSIEAGPCMEYLLQQKILETLQTLGRGDTPPGMKQHTLIFFTTLLGRIRQPLLPHVAVFQPVLKLIKLCGQVQAAPTENEEINFLCIVCAKLKEKSHLVNFFIQDEQLENERKMQKAKMEAKAAENVLKGVEQDQQKALIAQKLSAVKLQDSGTISIENSHIENSSSQNSQINSSQDSSNNFSESQRIATPASSVNQNEQESEISNSSIIKDPEVVATASQVSSFRTDNSSVGSIVSGSSNSKYRSVSGGGSVANTSTDNSRTTSQEIGQEFPLASDQAMGGTNSQLSDISEKSGSARADDSDGGNSEHLTKSEKTTENSNSNLTTSNSRHTSSLTSSQVNSLAATQDTKSNLKNSTINSSENSSSTANQNQSQAITTSNYSESQNQETFSSSAISYYNDQTNNPTDSSKLTTGETFSDSEDEFTNSDEERNLAELRIAALAKSRTEQDQSRARLQKYLSRYQTKNTQFDLAESLLNLSKSPDSRIGQKAHEALLLLVALPEKNCARALIRTTSMRELFCTKLVYLLISLPGPHCFPSAEPIHPTDIDETEGYGWGEIIGAGSDNLVTWYAGKQELRQVLSLWDFMDKLIMESHFIYASPMARAIRRKVLEHTFKQLLTRQAEEDALLSFNALLIKLLQVTTSLQLRYQLCMFILNKHESKNSEIKENSDDHDPFPGLSLKKKTNINPDSNEKSIKKLTGKAINMQMTNTFEVLLDRCNHVSEAISINSLRVFETLVIKPEPIFLESTILNYIADRKYLEDKSFIPQFDISDAVNAYLNILPENMRSSDDPGYEQYLRDAHQQLKSITRVCRRFRWPRALEVRVKQQKPKTTSDHSSSSDSDSDSDFSDEDLDWEIGGFIGTIFEKLGQLLNQSYMVNLEVTSLVAKLCALPHPAVTEFFLNPELHNFQSSAKLKPGVKTPYSILKEVASELIVRTTMMKDPKRLLVRTRRRLQGYEMPPNGNAVTTEEEERLLEGVIVLEEFCKELAAITFVKFHAAQQQMNANNGNLVGDNVDRPIQAGPPPGGVNSNRMVNNGRNRNDSSNYNTNTPARGASGVNSLLDGVNSAASFGGGNILLATPE